MGIELVVNICRIDSTLSMFDFRYMRLLVFGDALQRSTPRSVALLQFPSLVFDSLVENIKQDEVTFSRAMFVNVFSPSCHYNGLHCLVSFPHKKLALKEVAISSPSLGLNSRENYMLL